MRDVRVRTGRLERNEVKKNWYYTIIIMHTIDQYVIA